MRSQMLQEETDELKALLDRQGYDYREGADAEIIEGLDKQGLPAAYRRFLIQIDPGDSAWRIGGQFTIVLHSADELGDWQTTESQEDEQFVIGSLNGQPLVLGVAPDGDTAVYRLDEDGPVCVASSVVQFLRILRTGLDLLGKLADYDEDGEESDEGYDDMNDYEEGAFASGREDVLNDYLEEIESIDPDVVEAWTPV